MRPLVLRAPAVPGFACPSWSEGHLDVRGCVTRVSLREARLCLAVGTWRLAPRLRRACRCLRPVFLSDCVDTLSLLSRSSAAAVNVNSVLFSFLIFAPSINSPLLNKEVLHVYGFRCEVNYEFYGFRVLASEFFLFQDYVDVHQCFQKSH